MRLNSSLKWGFTAKQAVIIRGNLGKAPYASGDAGSLTYRAVELGVKFRSDVNGCITGIWFYLASTSTGACVANLWTSTGTLPATATFTNETASAWQQVSFSTTVATANRNTLPTVTPIGVITATTQITSEARR